MFLRIAVSVCAIAVFVAASDRAGAQEGAPDDEQARIAMLITQLGHDEFKVREQATADLRKIGFSAMVKLKAALQSDDPEVTERAQSILDSIALGVVEEAPAELIRIVREFDGLTTTEQSAAIGRMARELGPKATPWLVARVREDNRWYSPTALGWLTNGTNDDVRAYVKEFLKDVTNAHEARLKAWVDPVPKATPIPYVPGKMNLDAQPGDWKDIKPLPRPMADNARGLMRMAWSEDGIYLYYEVGNRQLIVQPDNPWFGDCLELFIDLDFKRGFVRNATGDAQVAFMPGDQPGPGRVKAVFGPVGKVEGTVRCVWRKTDEGYALEAHMSADGLKPLKLKPDAKLGMNYAVSDDGRTFEQFVCDKNENSGWESPILWGPCVLQAKPEEEEKGTEPAE